MIEISDVSRLEATAVCIVAFGESEIMMSHLRDSERFLLIHDNGAFLGVFGAARTTLLSDTAYVWFAETPEVTAHRVAFIRGVARVRDILFDDYSTLVGLSFDPRAIRWLTWLGAVFDFDQHRFCFRRVNG